MLQTQEQRRSFGELIKKLSLSLIHAPLFSVSALFFTALSVLFGEVLWPWESQVELSGGTYVFCWSWFRAVLRDGLASLV